MRFLSSKVHTIIGLVVGVVLLHASHIFGFSDNRTAAAVSFCVGIVTILSELNVSNFAKNKRLMYEYGDLQLCTDLRIDIGQGLFCNARLSTKNIRTIAQLWSILST